MLGCLRCASCMAWSIAAQIFPYRAGTLNHQIFPSAAVSLDARDLLTANSRYSGSHLVAGASLAHLHTRSCQACAVDAHAPRGDPFLRRPAGAQPRRGNQLLQTLCQCKAPLFLSPSGQTAARTGSAFFRPPRPAPRIRAAPARALFRPWKRSARRPPAPP